MKELGPEMLVWIRSLDGLARSSGAGTDYTTQEAATPDLLLALVFLALVGKLE